jgi:hypothetical protein
MAPKHSKSQKKKKKIVNFLKVYRQLPNEQINGTTGHVFSWNMKPLDIHKSKVAKYCQIFPNKCHADNENVKSEQYDEITLKSEENCKEGNGEEEVVNRQSLSCGTFNI